MNRFLYIIGSDNTSPIKLGIANNPKKRIKQLQTGNSEKLSIHHTLQLPYDNCRTFERILHYSLRRYRLKGEWFDMSPKEAFDYITFLMIHLDINQDLKKYLPNGSLHFTIAQLI